MHPQDFQVRFYDVEPVNIPHKEVGIKTVSLIIYRKQKGILSYISMKGTSRNECS